MASSPKKQKLSQRKFAGAATYLSTYKKEWEKKYPVSPGLTTHDFRCNACLCNVNCSHHGESDVKRHCKGATHLKRQKAMENTHSLDRFGFTKASDPIRDQVSYFCYDLLDFIDALFVFVIFSSHPC